MNKTTLSKESQRQAVFAFFSVIKEQMDPTTVREAFSEMGFKAVKTDQDSATGEPDMPAICKALGFDPTNHHNAAKCPYCTPSQPTVPVCRLLTAQESREAYKSVLDFSQSPARARAEVQRKFCEVNGLTLAAPTPKDKT
jgi:hypothetical protein